jgi:branched-chain amino acid transport system ATP-binding protein
VSLLTLDEIDVAYGGLVALERVSLDVGEGEIVAVVGANGAGKTTTLRAISGLVALRRGRIRFAGEPADDLPSHVRVGRGLIHVPEGRKVFPALSVMENLELGAYTARARARRDETLSRVLALFPILRERARQVTGTLSGGQQQMLAIGRGLMGLPRLLMLDEPSLGLAPLVVEEIFRAVAEVNRAGTTLLLVEQNTRQALAVAHRAYVLENGRVAQSGPAAALLDDPHVRRAYLGM